MASQNTLKGTSKSSALASQNTLRGTSKSSALASQNTLRGTHNEVTAACEEPRRALEETQKSPRGRNRNRLSLPARPQRDRIRSARAGLCNDMATRGRHQVPPAECSPLVSRGSPRMAAEPNICQAHCASDTGAMFGATACCSSHVTQRDEVVMNNRRDDGC